MKTLAQFLLIIVTVILSTGTLAVHAAQTELVHVKMAALLGSTMSPVFIAIQNGYFKDEGIDLEFVEVASGPLGEAAVISGNAQFTDDIDVDDLVTLQEQGQDPIFVYNMVNSLTLSMIIRNDVLERVGVTRESPLAEREKALKGLTLGITAPGGSSDIYTRWLLQQAGLDPDTDATLIAVGNSAARLSALEAGQIDAYLGAPPQTFIAVQNNIGTILINFPEGDVPQFKDFAFDAISVSKAWAEANPQVVIGFSRALDRAYLFMIEHTDEAVQILHDAYFPDTPLDLLRISVDVVLSAMIPDGRINPVALRNQAEVQIGAGTITELPDLSEGVLWTNAWNPDTLPDLMATAEATAAS